MEERNIVKFKKEEFSMREKIKEEIGKGKVSRVKIEYAPIGERIIISTSKPGLIIGRGGERIEQLTDMIRKKFKLENPHIEIDEIKNPEFDAQLIADELALGLERFGPLKFKVLAYKALQRIMKAGALGAELRLTGKLPSARSKSWRFAQGYLKKTGDTANAVDRVQSIAHTKPGVVGVKISILHPDAVLKDRIKINDRMLEKLRSNASKEMKEESKIKKGSKKK
ncbi:30S ribosomal protein S3 [Candidatus Pacearchaeota archaeon CG1_02_30_18]|nr:MAG: 30S ribosomal protein S3 [Candidatus Pacearchaeota archaeon CG1_02_30_18]PIN71680.1 MAG: 30S ribosomal protein S3 [Candidatus Pacearchaeota archaeon CG11_big_fil_rev_8_21_14_0_20_30_13]PIZ82205.1 MAG: 30S ribosomal protein S3 [Candidatus Pacearchaeota archaeon CG_4_10_14_0_2_um_filter_30_11]PJA71698.1 MAG: 30S ribosomal protein S3 [Candidatus Pacearchaeota archaeon CG_4_9_14_3_um_filter_30_11]